MAHPLSHPLGRYRAPILLLALSVSLLFRVVVTFSWYLTWKQSCHDVQMYATVWQFGEGKLLLLHGTHHQHTLHVNPPTLILQWQQCTCAKLTACTRVSATAMCSSWAMMVCTLQAADTTAHLLHSNGYRTNNMHSADNPQTTPV